MILTSFARALAQIGDPRFFRVLILGLALTIALLIGVYALFVWALDAFIPGSFTLPWIGEVGGVHTVIGWGSALIVLILSVFLMVPVASAFTGFFVEDVAQAVEDRHYPRLPPVPRLPLGDSLIDAANFLGLMLIANLLALILYFFAGPFIPLIFWAINGYLLGREYFTLVAMRRLGRDGARALRARHSGTIWLAGVLMAAPLSIPIVNLLIPVLGVATFTHLFHALNGDQGFVSSPTGV